MGKGIIYIEMIYEFIIINTVWLKCVLEFLFLDTEGGQVSCALKSSPFGVGIVVRLRAFVFQLVVLGRSLSRPPGTLLHISSDSDRVCHSLLSNSSCALLQT